MLNKSIALFLLVLCFSFNTYAEEVSVALKKDTLVSVSYTHLTLPTKA